MDASFFLPPVTSTASCRGLNVLLYRIIIRVVNDMCDPLLSFGVNYMYHCLRPILLVTFVFCAKF